MEWLVMVLIGGGILLWTSIKDSVHRNERNKRNPRGEDMHGDELAQWLRRDSHIREEQDKRTFL